MTEVQVGAVIAAAGQSQRMGGLDKLFVPLAGRPLLSHTLAAFEASPSVGRVILVVAAANLVQGRRLVEEGGFRKVAAVCPGGQRRRDSVRAGLLALGSCRWVIIHDGARPLVASDLLERGLAAAQATGAAIAVLSLVDTVKEVDESGQVVATLPRQRLSAVQTPQVFDYDLLWQAHNASDEDAADDAGLVERLGHAVRVFEGSALNIKVTTPADLALAKALLRTAEQAVKPRLPGQLT